MISLHTYNDYNVYKLWNHTTEYENTCLTIVNVGFSL